MAAPSTWMSFVTPSSKQQRNRESTTLRSLMALWSAHDRCGSARLAQMRRQSVPAPVHPRRVMGPRLTAGSGPPPYRLLSPPSRHHPHRALVRSEKLVETLADLALQTTATASVCTRACALSRDPFKFSSFCTDRGGPHPPWRAGPGGYTAPEAHGQACKRDGTVGAPTEPRSAWSALEGRLPPCDDPALH